MIRRTGGEAPETEQGRFTIAGRGAVAYGPCCRGETLMKTDLPARPSLAGTIGMQCAWLSIASGVVSLAVALIIWWQPSIPDLTRIGQHAGLFSAAIGLTLAGIGAASQRKRVRRVAAGAVIVNLFILAITLDSIFSILR